MYSCMYFRVSIKIFIFRVCIVYFANFLIVYSRLFNTNINYSIFIFHVLFYTQRVHVYNFCIIYSTFCTYMYISTACITWYSEQFFSQKIKNFSVYCVKWFCTQTTNRVFSCIIIIFVYVRVFFNYSSCMYFLVSKYTIHDTRYTIHVVYWKLSSDG